MSAAADAAFRSSQTILAGDTSAIQSGIRQGGTHQAYLTQIG
jgi:hypothetical protein